MTTWFDAQGDLVSNFDVEGKLVGRYFSGTLMSDGYSAVRGNILIEKAIEEIIDAGKNLRKAPLPHFLKLANSSDRLGTMIAVMASNPDIIDEPDIEISNRITLHYHSRNLAAERVDIEIEQDGIVAFTDYHLTTKRVRHLCEVTAHQHDLFTRIAESNSRTTMNEYLRPGLLSFKIAIGNGELNVPDILKRFRSGGTERINSTGLIEYLIKNLQLQERFAVAVSNVCKESFQSAYQLEERVRYVDNMATNPRLVVKATNGERFVMTPFTNRTIARAEQISLYEMSRRSSFVQGTNFREPIELDDIGVYLTVQNYVPDLTPGATNLVYIAAALGRLSAIGQEMVAELGKIVPAYEKIMEYEEVMELVSFSQGRHKAICPSRVRNLKRLYQDSLCDTMQQPFIWMDGDSKFENVGNWKQGKPIFYDWDSAGPFYLGWNLVQLFFDPKRDIDESQRHALSEIFIANYADQKGIGYDESKLFNPLELARTARPARTINAIGLNLANIHDPNALSKLHYLEALLDLRKIRS